MSDEEENVIDLIAGMIIPLGGLMIYGLGIHNILPDPDCIWLYGELLS